MLNRYEQMTVSSSIIQYHPVSSSIIQYNSSFVPVSSISISRQRISEFSSHRSCTTLWQVLASRIYNWLLDFNKLNILVNHFYFVGVQGLHLVLHKYIGISSYRIISPVYEYDRR